jgi:hypothetical protein
MRAILPILSSARVVGGAGVDRPMVSPVKDFVGNNTPLTKKKHRLVLSMDAPSIRTDAGAWFP